MKSNNMTPKEKAEELITKFSDCNQEDYCPLVEIASIKQAIECTGEILSSIRIIIVECYEHLPQKQRNEIVEYEKYWEEVFDILVIKGLTWG